MALGRPERIDFRTTKSKEIEANQFAMGILLPEKVFKQVTRALDGNITKIAKEFGVGTLVVRFRAKGLGIKGHGL